MANYHMNMALYYHLINYVSPPVDFYFSHSERQGFSSDTSSKLGDGG